MSPRDKTFGIICVLATSIGLTACSDAGRVEAPAAGQRPAICVVNYPLRYFAERIGGDLVQVRLPAPAGEDPAYWEPDAAAIEACQNADLILLNGATYAKWVERASLPPSRLVDTSAAFKDQYIAIDAAVTHNHGPEGEHAHGGTAFTTWLDPALAARHARAISQSLSRLLPDETATIAENLAALEKDLRALDAGFKEVTRDGNREPLLASHPVYQYFARRYELNLRSVHWEPDEMPAASQWSSLDKLLEDHPAKWMIWEAPPAGEIAARLNKSGVRCAVLLPCGNVPGDGDYLQVMKRNVERLRPVFAVPK